MAGPRGEFALIESFARLLPRGGEGVVVDVGDDAAVLRPPRGELLVATVDAVVEGVHFDRRFSAEDVGWKSLAVNLSDLAAMGARPLWALCAMAFPRGEGRLGGIARGLARCGRRFGLAVVGGNMTRARELSITIAVVGSVRAGRVLTREGARVGDAVMVSGTLGDAALGLEKGAAASLVRRQHRPFPRLALGRALAGIATAAIDLSDGLLLDLGHLCHSSGVGASVRLSELPLSPAYLARVAGRPDQYGPALAGGEDYELCFTVPVRRVPEAIAAARKLRIPLSTVGSIIAGEGVRVARCRGGLHLAKHFGHDHFA